MFWPFKLSYGVDIWVFWLWQLFWLLFSKSWVIFLQYSGHPDGKTVSPNFFFGQIEERDRH
jgi:hypothetical protein